MAPRTPSNRPLEWLVEHIIWPEIQGLRKDTNDLKKTVEGYGRQIPDCSKRFDNLERRVGAPGRWMKSRLKILVDESTRQAIRWSTLALIGFLLVHFFP